MITIVAAHHADGVALARLVYLQPKHYAVVTSAKELAQYSGQMLIVETDGFAAMRDYADIDRRITMFGMPAIRLSLAALQWASGR